MPADNSAAEDVGHAGLRRLNDDEATTLDGTAIALGIPGPTLSIASQDALIEAATFRDAMSRLASGVVVVTTRVTGRPWGVTVSACCSISADPPQVLVSLNRNTFAWRAIRERGSFGVTVLRTNQLNLARYCSAPGIPKFIEDYLDPAAPDDDTGNPDLPGGLCHLGCRLAKTVSVATHMLLVGGVVSARVDVDAPDDPILYFRREFHSLGDDLAT
jgi:flavin reductase (DIM6/NTAB) family NADH-FMN oxidoreductase RutF